MKKFLVIVIFVLLMLITILPTFASSPVDKPLFVPTPAPTEFPPAGNSPKFGVYHHYASEANFLSDGKHVSFTIEWSVVEATKGTYDWTVPDVIYNSLPGYFDKTIQFKWTPVWARANGASDPACVKPKSIYRDEFADFVNAAITRYSPTGTKAVHGVLLWNEPEVTGNPNLGCFPNGASYGNFVATVYPLIKAVHPNVKVAAGEFASSDTGWTDNFYVNANGNFDAISFHIYNQPNWWNTDVLSDWVDYHDSKNGDAEIWLTETAFRCNLYPGGTCTGDYEDQKAVYVEYLINNTDNIDLITYYHMKDDGYAQIGLIYGSTPAPAWDIYDDYLGGWGVTNPP